jgi:hypothetical protein
MLVSEPDEWTALIYYHISQSSAMGVLLAELRKYLIKDKIQ